jgi:hypothetical protein
MHDYQREFIEFSLEHEVLRFGEFTLKSGRTSPYFFNAGLFNTGARLAALGRFYAAAIDRSEVEFDVLLGPAYRASRSPPLPPSSSRSSSVGTCRGASTARSRRTTARAA